MASSLKDYLKRYTSPTSADVAGKGKSKKKRKVTRTSKGNGVVIVDDDALWQKEEKLDADDEPDEEGEGPQVIEDVEVKRMQRMEELKTHRPYLCVSNDGSGWVTVKDDQQDEAVAGNSNSSSPRSAADKFPDLTLERRHDSPEFSAKRKRMDSPDLSPPRRKEHSAPGSPSPDLSPPRRRHDSPDFSAKGQRRDSSDLSPPRRKASSPDNAPRSRADSPDLSPPRKRNGSDDSHGMPKMSRKVNTGSPPRRSKFSTPARNRNESQELSPPREKFTARMGDGTAAGLKSNKEVALEIERKKAAEAQLLRDLDPSLSGHGAETVFRDKRGRRLEGLEDLMKQQKGVPKEAEQPLEWGKGLVQKKEAAANLAELDAEKSKPFARYRDDAELEKSLKERVRWGDPMAHLVKQKIDEPVLEDLGARQEMQASGFVIPQDIPKHSWIKRGIPAPVNRYGIKPGRHWDGVDRSTGFERDMFKAKNEKKARDQEAYLWSVSDM